MLQELVARILLVFFIIGAAAKPADDGNSVAMKARADANAKDMPKTAT